MTRRKDHKRTRMERFWSKFVKLPNGCWQWTGAIRAEHGYGVFGFDRRTVPAHRYSYEYLVGPIADGLVLDHLCRNRACVNPAHLEPVTARENILRGVSPSATKAKQTHCKRGHEFTPENTYWVREGRGRHCRTCVGMRSRGEL